MIKISEFTPALSATKENQSTASATSSCKVIINSNTGNTNATSEEDKKENINDNGAYPTVNPEPFTVPSVPLTSSYYPPTIQEAPLMAPINSMDLYKHLAVSFSNILKSNNPKLIANIIDNSGKVILSAMDIITAISLMLMVDTNSIKINYIETENTGCLCNKLNPIKNISSIKVNGYDFNLAFNKQYNMLSDDFGVSLTRCLII